MKQVLERVLDDNGPFVAMLRKGLEGLTDAEYLWEPVDDCWSIRPTSALRTPAPPWASSQGYALEIAYPDPIPAPFTTVAWRLVHLTGSIDVAAATLRGERRPDGAIDGAWAPGRGVPATASEAVEQLNTSIPELQSLVADASDDDLVREERQWWDPPTSSTAVWEHVMYFGYFEPASHAAEVRLMRDLYRHTNGGAIALRAP